MKIWRCSYLLAAALTAACPAWAGEGPLPRPSEAAKIHHVLKPGSAAGVNHAQQIESGVALMAGGGVVAVVALVAGTGGGSAVPQAEGQAIPTTTTTP